MELIRATLGLPREGYRADARLAELRFGRWEGFGWKELRRREAALYAVRERDRWSFEPPGGGESYAGLTGRLAAALADLTGPSVIVSHGGVARAMMTMIGGASPAEALRALIWQGRILRFAEGGCDWM